MSVWKYEKSRVMTIRLLGISVVFALIGCVILGRLFYLQVLHRMVFRCGCSCQYSRTFSRPCPNSRKVLFRVCPCCS